MEYAKTLVPTSLMRSVSSVQTSLAQRMLPSPQPRPYKVCAQNRRRRRGFTATSLADLMEQVASSFLITCQFFTLVLEDDGTVVDTEAFFQSLPTNTAFMVLEKGEAWTPNKLITGSLRVGKEVMVSVDFQNPYNFILQKVQLRIDGPGLISTKLKRYSQIFPGASVKYKVSLFPRSLGKKVLMACLDCPLLRQVTNQLEFEVVQDYSVNGNDIEKRQGKWN